MSTILTLEDFKASIIHELNKKRHQDGKKDLTEARILELYQYWLKPIKD